MKSERSPALPVLVFLCCILFLPVLSFAGEKGVYTLNSSIQEALSNNWSLKAKLERMEQASEVKK